LITALKYVSKKFPGLSLHNRVAIIAPNEQTIRQLRSQNICDRIEFECGNFEFVDAATASTCVVATSSSREGRKVPEKQWLVLDTVDNFNGLERLIVIAVDLDSPINCASGVRVQVADLNISESRSQLYRAITRAHMMVLVVNEVQYGGWLEFLTRVEYDKKSKIEEELETKWDAKGKARAILKKVTALPVVAAGEAVAAPTATVAGLATATVAAARAAAAAAAGAAAPAAPIGSTLQWLGREAAFAIGAAQPAGAFVTVSASVPQAAAAAAAAAGGGGGEKVKVSVWDTSHISGISGRSMAEIAENGFMPLRIGRPSETGPPSETEWPFNMDSAQAEAMKAFKIPVVVVIGETGAGKSTALNRMSSAFGGEGDKYLKRVRAFVEGDSASAGTNDTRGKLLGWKGDVQNKPVFFVDTPGLNDPQGRDTKIIRECCQFLTDLDHPYASQFVLVIDGTNPRMSKPLREIIRVYKRVFDADGSRNFVNYLTVMFTKFPYSEWTEEEKEDGEDGPGFDSQCAEKKKYLMNGWIEQLCDPLGIEGPDAEKAKKGLKERFVFVNNGLTPKMLKKLRDEFEVDVSADLEVVYHAAYRAKENAFPLRDVVAVESSDAVAAWIQTVIPGDLGKRYADGLCDGFVDGDTMDSFPLGGHELTDYGIQKKHCRTILARWAKLKSSAPYGGS
jgi:hypothetical protein